MLVSSFLRNRQIRYIMVLAGTPSFTLPPFQPSKVGDPNRAGELCEVVYPDLSPLDGTVILSLFSPGPQISSDSYQDAKCSASNSLKQQLLSSTWYVLNVLSLGVFSFEAAFHSKSGFHGKSIYFSYGHCASNTTP